MNSNVLINYIENSYPELKGKELVFNDYGWANYILIVDNKLIFRFPRNEESKKQLILEQKLLCKLNLKLQGLIPNFIYSSKERDEFTYVGYELIPGNSLESEEFRLFDEQEKNILAQKLGDFLTILHNFNYEGSSVVAMSIEETKENWRCFLEEIRELVFPLLTGEEKEWTINLFNSFLNDEDNFSFIPCLIHGDLGSDHIIYDFDKRRLAGIIDFGDIQVGDPSYDFIGIYIAYGKEFACEVFSYYQGNKDKNFISRIENFYYKRTPFYGIIHGIKTNNQQLQKDCLDWLRTIILGS